MKTEEQPSFFEFFCIVPFDRIRVGGGSFSMPLLSHSMLPSFSETNDLKGYSTGVGNSFGIAGHIRDKLSISAPILKFTLGLKNED